MRNLGRVGAGIGILLCVPAAEAAQNSANFTVRINVQTSCSVSAGNLDFGAVGMIGGGETATASLRVNCSQGTPYTISFNSAASITAFNGQMSNGASHVGYSASLPAAGGTGPAIHTIRAVLLPQTTPPAGVYTDSRTVYLNY